MEIVYGIVMMLCAILIWEDRNKERARADRAEEAFRNLARKYRILKNQEK
jgi:hypothetical protein